MWQRKEISIGSKIYLINLLLRFVILFLASYLKKKFPKFQVSRRLRSQSLQLFNGLAIWRCVPMIVQLEKDSRGLGFSIVDYQVNCEAK